mgnify:CR=1 FL=1
MANISREADLKDLEERTRNGGNRPNANENALGCMFHLDKNCSCPQCRGLKQRLEESAQDVRKT